MRSVALACALLAVWPLSPDAKTERDVTRATLDNGLRVVIIRDPLAPVATVEMNYLVGADETPAGFPAADMEVALQVEAACLREIADAPEAWSLEKGAVARDLSEPTYRLLTRLNERFFARTLSKDLGRRCR